MVTKLFEKLTLTPGTKHKPVDGADRIGTGLRGCPFLRCLTLFFHFQYSIRLANAAM